MVALLILLNVVLGSRQELKARARVDALANLQVPLVRALRDGQIPLVPSMDVVPGDVVAVEAGDPHVMSRPPRIRSRRSPTAAISLVPVVMIVLATQLPAWQQGLVTTSLTGTQRVQSASLALLLPVVIEGSKWIRLRRAASPTVTAP